MVESENIRNESEPTHDETEAKGLRGWAMRHLRGKYAEWWLAGFSFTESSFFLVPPDILLLAMLSAGAKPWWRFATITTVMSVLGGAFGYFIGFALFDVVGQRIVDAYGLAVGFARVEALFMQNNFWVIFVSAFTPIPYKVFTISAGLFKVNFFTFILASIAGRGLRFFIVAFFAHVFGKKYGHLILRFLDWFTIAMLVVIGALILHTFL